MTDGAREPALAANPAPRPVAAVSYQDLWKACDEERFRAAVSKDALAAERPDDAAHFAHRELCFIKLQTIVGRVADDDILKERLIELAREAAEREAVLAALDNPDKEKQE